MISGVFRGGIARRLAFATPALVVFLFSGCDDGYPTELKYPTRMDLIVLSNSVPGTQETDPDPPGGLDDHIRSLEGKGGKVLDPNKLDGKQRAEIRAALEKCFGTPAKPRVTIESKQDDYTKFVEAVKGLQLDDATLEAGSKLYRRHCLHCHGVTGDGRGPTGPWLNPHPRDYRKGLFKFISTKSSEGTAQPARDDLLRVLKNGIDYTSMPSFGLLPERELEQLVSYVTHLSLRGVAEEETMSKLLSKAPLTTVDGDELSSIDAYIQYSARYAILRRGGWAEASAIQVDSDETPTSLVAKPDTQTHGEETTDAAIRKGFQLFNKTEALCSSCHTNYGRDSNYRYDKWGTLVQPRNLTAGALRGGRRPIDLYWRIKAGIDPAGMPKAGLSDKEIWCVVEFVQALPYPNMLPEDVRARIYGGTYTAKKD